MRKRLFIPTVLLGQDNQGDLLELTVDSTVFFNDNSFKSLVGCHLDAAIEIASRVLPLLPKPKRKSCLYLVNPNPYLSNSKGAGLGLVLALFMLEKQCPHQVLIVTGILDGSTGKNDISIADSGNLNLRLSAAMALGPQQQATPFLVPANSTVDSELVEKLARFSIFVCPVRTLTEALKYCLSPLPNSVFSQGALI